MLMLMLCYVDVSLRPQEAQLSDAVAQSWREATPETKAYYEQRATRINAVEEKKYLQQIRAR